MSQGNQGIAELFNHPQAGYFHHGEIQARHRKRRPGLPLPQFFTPLQRTALPQPHLLPVSHQDHQGTLPAAEQLEHAVPEVSGAEGDTGQGDDGAFHGVGGTVREYRE